MDAVDGPARPPYTSFDDDDGELVDSRTNLLTSQRQTDLDNLDATHAGGYNIDDARIVFRTSYYIVFVLLGVAMLWSWNAFLAAGTYFLSRLHDSPRLAASFQSAEMSISTATALLANFVCSNIQHNANYARRIISALVALSAVFLLLTPSTVAFLDMDTNWYYSLVLFAVFVSSTASGLLQNGIFAYMAGFGIQEYAQGVMMGNAIAGVLPSLIQFISILSVREKGDDTRNKSKSISRHLHATRVPQPVPREHGSLTALIYFSSALVMTTITLLSFFWLLAQQRRRQRLVAAIVADSSTPLTPRPVPMHNASSITPLVEKRRVPLLLVFKKTRYLALSVFGTFVVTMVFPIFTLRIQSVNYTGPDTSASLPLLSQPRAFQPLAFLVWNCGDLSGRIVSAIPRLAVASKHPRSMLLATFGRLVWIPMYIYLCNLDGAGHGLIKSDEFYLAVVQYLFGLTNGYIATTCMMAASEFAEEDEREATGAFMILMLTAGLTVGSLLSFFAL